ncbi:DUF4160 domain-containing protein [Streptococcus ferus]|uniref:DUF4160 domain-containing protein n=1 Tax=Streptococcus ferus TaxID=1345 RepID=UPI002355731B|nr:DUF4160 domain-containing protein [Streptococcus ferus]
MPILYANNGLVIRINNREKGHKRPHVHVFYKGEDYSFAFDGEQLNGGRLPRKVRQEIQWYLANNQEALKSIWRGDF